jgi:hypothetical protein
VIAPPMPASRTVPMLRTVVSLVEARCVAEMRAGGFAVVVTLAPDRAVV